MPVPTLISQLSTTASLNSPDGAVDVPSSIDDYQRAHAAFIAQLYAGTVAAPTVIVPSATTTDIGAAASENVDISGNTTITGFGTVAEGINRKGRFTGVLTLTHNATSLILPGNANITTAANDRYEARSLGGGNWIVTKYQYASGYASGLVQSVDIQNQTVTAFTTGGTSTAYTLTPSPAIAALAANQRFRVKFHTASGATPTLAISGLVAKNLKYKDSAGAKQAITAKQVPTSWVSDVEYDGTDMVVLDPVLGEAIPSGAIAFFAMATAPTGYIKANGALVSRTTYASLFSAIGTTFGVGDGSTTFALPDLRAEFIRGWDDARGVDSGRVFGSAQAADIAPHNHGLRGSGTWNTVGGGGSPMIDGLNNTLVRYTDNSTGTETRPRNIALLACIKF